MKPKLFAALLLTSAALAGPALAEGTFTPHIDQAQQAIGARIQAALASGQITPSQAQLLIRRDREIQLRENRVKANGSATQQERQQLRAELNALGADVERMIANRDAMPPPPYASNSTYPGNPGSGIATPGIDNREYQIGQRIEDGLRSGRISQRQAQKLQSREREIARHESFFKSDGVVTRQERRQLRDELDRLRSDVERHIADGQRNRG